MRGSRSWKAKGHERFTLAGRACRRRRLNGACRQADSMRRLDRSDAVSAGLARPTAAGGLLDVGLSPSAALSTPDDVLEASGVRVRKKAVQERRDRNRALAKADRANRCAICKRSLLEVGMKTVVVVGGVTQKICTQCVEEDQ